MDLPDITQQINDAFDAEDRQKPRAYIGASGVGNLCDAYLAFCHRGYPDVPTDAQLKRIFRDGHRIEDIVVKDLRKTGLHVMEVNPMTSKQWRWEAYGGHAMGNADGLVEIDGETLGLEIKSMNDSKHKECAKKGVKYSHPNYYDQMQFMMGLSGIKKFLFVSYNKNNSSYLHEYIDFDEFRFSYLKTRVETVLRQESRRCATDESDWRCKSCFKRDACWRGELPEQRIMRTCGNAKPNKEGEWSCDKCSDGVCHDWVPYEPLPREGT